MWIKMNVGEYDTVGGWLSVMVFSLTVGPPPTP